MRNRNKRKKENDNDVENISKQTQNNNKENDNNEPRNQSQSKSRSRSRNRRSLSALFRRSVAQDESKDKEVSMVNDTEPMDVAISDINPRVNPRGHLQRMTVREALVYNRKRGRSPNRRALKLEKKLLSDTDAVETESLSTSMPDLLDQISDCYERGNASKGKEAKGGSTLPRMKKRRPVSEGTTAKLFSDIRTTDTALPLDKRKYIIKRDSSAERETTIDADNADIRSLNNSHSIELSDRLRQSIKSIQTVESHSRDSVGHNLEVGGIISHNSVLSSTVQIEPDSSRMQILPNISISKSTTQESLIQPTLVSDVFVDMQYTDRLGTSNSSNIVSGIRKDTTGSLSSFGGSSNETDKVERQVLSEKDKSTRRSSYVSPRRFSRASRPSVTSNKSSISDNSNQSVQVTDDNVAQKSSLSDTLKVKYQRQFSRDSRRPMVSDITQPAKIMVNKETLVDIRDLSNLLIDSSTQTVDDSLCPPKYVDAACQSSEDIITADNDETTINTPYGIKIKNNEQCQPDKPKFQREVVIVEPGTPVRTLRQQSVDSVFKPIKVNKQRKVSEIIVDNTIEQIHDTLEKPTEKLSRSSSKRKSKKSKKRKTSTGSKTKRQSSENEELKPSKSTEQSISESTQEGNNSKRSRSKSLPRHHSREKEYDRPRAKCTEDIGTIKKSSRPRRSRSLGRKTSRDKKDKSVAEALRKVGRAASLSQVFNSLESLRNDETEETKLLKDSNKSKSLTSINRDTSENFRESLRRLKSENDKPKQKHPKLSLAAVVALKSRIARMKRSKQSTKDKKTEEGENQNDEDNDIPRNNSNSNNPEVSLENDDLSTAKVLYENEINTSIGKSTNSIEIVEATDQEVKDIVYEKRIQFSTPYGDDPLSEEELIKQRQRNTRLTTRRESKVRQRQKKVINCCKKFIAFLFSHIGLCSLVVAYCILGGFIFKRLEGPHEMIKKKEITALRLNFTDKIHKLAFETALTKGNREIFRAEVNTILRDFSVMIHKQTKEAGWDGQEVRNDTKNGTGPVEPEQWSYPSSLLYAITVMTTIGKLLL